MNQGFETLVAQIKDGDTFIFFKKKKYNDTVLVGLFLIAIRATVQYNRYYEY